MVNYIVRRVLLMIPTLIGITLVVFMLIALSPGGVGAGVLAAGGGGAMQSSSSIAIQRAKIEDRYGLNEPVLVQYVRWLGRISPIRIGQRDIISPSGEVISRPRPIPEPAAWNWFAANLPDVPAAKLDEIRAGLASESDADRTRLFRDLTRRYVEARAAFTTADAELRDALKRYVEAVYDRSEWDRFVTTRGVRAARLARETASKADPAFAELEPLGQRAIEAWRAAAEAREKFVAGFALSPDPRAGVPLLPGDVLSLAWPDLGISFRGRPVAALIATHLPVTLLLNALAFPIIYAVAIPSGMLAAVRRGTWADVGLGGLYIGLYSVPVVLAGVLALGFLATPEYLAAFPPSGLHDKDADTFSFLPSFGGGSWQRGYVGDMLWHVVLPVACIVYGGFAVLSKQTRAAMLENLSADYVRTAKAKGVANRDVVFAHVFRNSLLPLITMFVTIFPAMLAGSVVIERIFSVPGMGSLLIDAINERDREIILANTTMIAVVNLLALLLADILYALADPRIAYK